jgi:EpsI family protein
MKDRSRFFISCALITGALLVVQFRSHGQAVELQRPLAEFPEILTGWRFQEGALLDEKTLSILKMSEYILRRYVDPTGRSLWFYVGYWDAQRKGAQIHSPKNCLPGSGWEPLQASRVTVDLAPANESITVNRYLIQKDQQQQLATYWYHSQGQPVASEMDAKLIGVKNAMLHNRTDGALVRLLSPIYGTVDQTFDMQVGFIRSMYPHLRRHLPKEGERG